MAKLLPFYPCWIPSNGRCVFPTPGATPTGAFSAARRGFPRIMSAARSASIIVGAFRLPFGSVGKTELSTTRKPSIPCTRNSGSTTAVLSVPILQVPQG